MHPSRRTFLVASGALAVVTPGVALAATVTSFDVVNGTVWARVMAGGSYEVCTSLGATCAKQEPTLEGLKVGAVTGGAFEVVSVKLGSGTREDYVLWIPGKEAKNVGLRVDAGLKPKQVPGLDSSLFDRTVAAFKALPPGAVLEELKKSVDVVSLVGTGVVCTVAAVAMPPAGVVCLTEAASTGVQLAISTIVNLAQRSTLSDADKAIWRGAGAALSAATTIGFGGIGDKAERVLLGGALVLQTLSFTAQELGRKDDLGMTFQLLGSSTGKIGALLKFK
jgi:hypothetical protein